jgi:hypothetical protein
MYYRLYFGFRFILFYDKYVGTIIVVKLSDVFFLISPHIRVSCSNLTFYTSGTFTFHNRLLNAYYKVKLKKTPDTISTATIFAT